MTRVFVDTLYWVARLNPRDPWYTAVRQAERRLGSTVRVTTDEVLTETLNALSGGGPILRGEAADLANRLRDRPDMMVLPQSRASFESGLDLYARRPDKQYSLTDCISMNAMRERGITDILTNDHHYEQEGFNVLIHR